MFTTALLRWSHTATSTIIPYHYSAVRCLSTTTTSLSHIHTGRSVTSSSWLRNQTRWRLAAKHEPSSRRYQNTVPRPASNPSAPSQAYPELVNVFLAPSSLTAFAGVIRVLTVCFLLAGTTWVAPSFYWDEATPLWLVPAAALGASMPFVMVIASGPVISSIRAHLPRHARNSKGDLMRFASNVPPNTRIRVQFLRVMPWLVTREMYFSELRRLPVSRVRLVNLEYVAADEEKRLAMLSPWLRRMVKALFCRYWISMASKERSQVKGAWDEMWRQIPVVGSKEDFDDVKKIAGVASRPRREGKAPAARIVPGDRSRRRGGGSVR